MTFGRERIGVYRISLL